MNNHFVIKFIDFLSPLFSRFEIDLIKFKKIIATKLLLEGKKTGGPLQYNQIENNAVMNFIKSMAIYMLYGLFIIYFLFQDVSMIQMATVFSMILFMISTAFIAEFSSMLLNVQEQTILGTKPVDKRTIVMAKIFYILYYLLTLSVAFLFIPTLFMLFKQGIVFTLLFLFSLLFSLLLIITSLSFIYFALIYFFDRDILKKAINFIQIIFIVAMMIGYQLIVWFYIKVEWGVGYVFEWWHFLIPPFWFAAPFELIINKTSDITVIILSLCAILIPIILVYLYYQFIDYVEAKLLKLMVAKSGRKASEGIWLKLWERMICHTEQSRIFFKTVYKIASRDQSFTVKLYPMLAISFILPFMFVFTEVSLRSKEVLEGPLYVSLYLSLLFISMLLSLFQYSKGDNNSWIFRVTGQLPSIPLYEAVFKVFIVKWYLPLYVIVAVIYYFLFPGMKIIDIAIIFVTAILVSELSYRFMIKAVYPFSINEEQLYAQSETFYGLISLLLPLPFAGFHYLLIYFFPVGLYVYFIVLTIFTFMLWRRLFYTYEKSI